MFSALSGPTPVQFVYQPPPSWVQQSTEPPLREMKEPKVEQITLPETVNLGNTYLRFHGWIFSGCVVTL